MNLDDEIDELLASRPVKAGDDFADRVLAEADARGLTRPDQKRALFRIAVPVAAAVALSFAAIQMLGPPAPAEGSASALNEIEISEILLLEEGLGGLSGLLPADVQPSVLGPTLETVNFTLGES